MVKSEQIYSPQNYLEGITGHCYIINGDNDIDFIQKVFNKWGYELWNYPMSEIDHIVENNLDVVLVDCMIWNKKTKEYEHVYRWFEVTEDFEQEYDEEKITMHSRIFQISTTPIDKVDYIEESNYYDHWFTNSVADYVSDNTDRNDDIQWLKDCYGERGISFGVDDSGEYLVIEDKLKYFASKFEAFQKALKELSTTTIDDFANGKCGYPLYSLKAAYNEKLGFYVDGEDFSLESFDGFVRLAGTGVKYYIGATIDYHC